MLIKKNVYNLIDFKTINDNRQYWKTVIPFVLDDSSQCSQINLVDYNNLISGDKSLSRI